MKNGYFFIKNFFTESQSSLIKICANKWENVETVKGKWMKYYEYSKGKKLSRIENFYHHDSELKNLTKTCIIPTLNYISGDKMVLFKDKLNFKFPGGKGFKPHQDQHAWSDFPPNYYVSVALFPDNHTIRNGCLQFPTDWDGSSRNIISESYLPESISNSWNPVTTTSRDILFFNSYIPHLSKENLSTTPRRTIFLTFNSETSGDHYEEYFKKKRENFPPENEMDPTKTYDMDSKYNLANHFTLKSNL